MSRTILIIRIVFLLVALGATFLLAYTVPEWDPYRWRILIIGGGLAALVILVDILLKGFSLRGLTALTFGLFIGWLMATFISDSPLFEHGDPELLFITRLAVFIVMMYLGSVVALRGKDDFNLLIPYVRFVPEQLDVPVAVVDTSALIDGRIVQICESKFLGHKLVVPGFVVQDLHQIADSRDPQRQARGRKGLESLNALRKMDHIDLRIHESSFDERRKQEAKIVFLAQNLKAKILTTDYNLAQLAELHHVEWLNLNALSKALNPELVVGDKIDVELVKNGREPGQAVGYLSDGSMVVVNEGRDRIGKRVSVEVQSILPSAGGRMVFANMVGRDPARS